MPNNDLLRDTISDKEIAETYNVSPQTVRKWAALGLLGPKVGLSREPRRDLETVRRAGKKGRAA